MQKTSSRVGNLTLLLAVLALIIIATMMFGARFELWEPIVGFALIRQYMNPSAYFVIGIAVLALIHQILTGNRWGSVKACLAVAIGVLLLGPLIYQKTQPTVYFPPIHDITTDTHNPPAFFALDENRPGAKNTLAYGGTEIAAIQIKHYPDIQPIQSSQSAIQAYSQALKIAQMMDWEVTVKDDNNLRFEAIARTPLYRFVDDVVVVVTPEGNASRVDIRSVSRVGRGDRGVNAMRIRRFISAFEN